MSTEERRAPGAPRIPFDALVEVGGALGPTFEAQAVNVSEEGIQLRTAYLPEPGQPLTCRFDGGSSQSILASGEVAWSQGGDQGGEFGVRFTELDAESVDALKRVCGVTASAVQPGAKVRLHIDGLASPMRAKIKDARQAAVTVGSDLGFLQVGRQLELEDALSGAKRPARIDRVDVAIDPTSSIPQLVVTLRYADVDEPAAMPEGAPPTIGAADIPKAGAGRAGSASGPAFQSDDLAAVEQASIEMKGAVARSAAKIGPALGRFAEQAKTMVGILARRALHRTDDSSGPRRTTSPAPGGGLHATGRRVVRGDSSPTTEGTAGVPKAPWTRRRALLVSGVMATALVGALALKAAHKEPNTRASTVGDPAADSASAAVAATPPASAAPPSPPPAAAPPEPAPSLASPPGRTAGADDDGDSEKIHRKHARVTPFGNGPVHHGNVLRLHMDGPIESIEGAQQPTGFTVKIPGRKATEAAAPLAARDARIAAIKVSNESAGAELTVAFKDGVPNYRVSAKGDSLVIALAPVGPIDQTVAKKDEKGGQSPKHAKRARDKKKTDQDL
jgi:hypothetical protein